MDREEESGLPTAVAEARENLKRLTIHDVDLHVLAVGQIHVLLSGVPRERDVPGGSVAKCKWRDLPFRHVGAVLPEDLESVVRAVADIDQAIVRRLGAVYGAAELSDEWSVRVVAAHVFVARHIAVCAPHTLDSTGLHIQHRDALVAVAIGDVDLAGLGVERDLGGSTEVLH